jgi:hypothetical protein
MDLRRIWPLASFVLIVHVTSTDPAGAVFNMARATNEHTEHTARVITTASIPDFQFPRDIHELYDSGEEIEALLLHADVIHFHKVNEEFEFDFSFPKSGKKKVFKIADFMTPERKRVYHIHGNPVERTNIGERAERYRKTGWPVLIQSPVLESQYKPFLNSQIQYFPNVVPIKDVRYMPRQTDALHTTTVNGKNPVEKYMVIQTPSNVVIKSTHVIRRAIERIGVDVPVFFFQVGPNPIIAQDTALRFMRAAHVVFDNLGGNAGLASLQGLSMGKPVIAGLHNKTVDSMCAFWDIERSQLPWLIAWRENEIETILSNLFNDDDYRRAVEKKSRTFMETIWSDNNIAKRLETIYKSL